MYIQLLLVFLDCSRTFITDCFVGRYQAGVGAMNGYVYAVGGCDSWNCLNSVERYDPTTDTWCSVAALITARRGCGVAVYNGKQFYFSSFAKIFCFHLSPDQSRYYSENFDF